MEESRLQHYRKQLEDLRQDLRASLAADSDETKAVAPDRAIGRLTRQDAMLSQQMALELQRRNRTRLTQVESALERMTDGSYGFCVRCEDEIADARLNVKPETPVCIHCAGGGRR